MPPASRAGYFNGFQIQDTTFLLQSDVHKETMGGAHPDAFGST
jgi:hypothetical protein